jgi:hypothetical protein
VDPTCAGGNPAFSPGGTGGSGGGSGKGSRFTLYDIAIRGCSSSHSDGIGNASGGQVVVSTTASKRFSDFQSFDSQLRKSRKSRGAGKLPPQCKLPSASVFSSFSPAVIEERRVGFQAYLNHLLGLRDDFAPALSSGGLSASSSASGSAFSPSSGPASAPVGGSALATAAASSSSVSSSSSSATSQGDSHTLALVLHFLLTMQSTRTPSGSVATPHASPSSE